MKKSILATALLGLALSACGSAGVTTSQSTSSAGNPATDHLAEILARGTLVLSTDPGYPPQSFAVKGAQRLMNTKCAENQTTGNQIAGYDAGVGKLVAKALGVEPCFVVPTWTEITGGNWGDRWDIAYGSGAINSDRMPRLWMTTPYRAEPQRYFVRVSSPYHSPSQLDGKSIGVCNSCTVEFYLQGHLAIPQVSTPLDVKSAKIVTYESEPPGLLAASQGKIDAYLSAAGEGEQAIRQGEHLRALPAAAFTMDDTGFLDKSSPRGQKAFAERVDQIITHLIQNGQLKALSMKYFGQDYATAGLKYNLAGLHQNIPGTSN
jgi:polar amino acid transport system substrate-binding protein